MSDFTKVTARGDKVVSISKDGNGRDIAIIDRTARANGDYTVAIGYHTETGDWEQGRYGFETQKAAEEWREKEYAADMKPSISTFAALFPERFFTKINSPNTPLLDVTKHFPSVTLARTLLPFTISFSEQLDKSRASARFPSIYPTGADTNNLPQNSCNNFSVAPATDFSFGKMTVL